MGWFVELDEDTIVTFPPGHTDMLLDIRLSRRRDDGTSLPLATWSKYSEQSKYNEQSKYSEHSKSKYSDGDDEEEIRFTPRAVVFQQSSFAIACYNL
jgi:hypothetical protein